MVCQPSSIFLDLRKWEMVFHFLVDSGFVEPKGNRHISVCHVWFLIFVLQATRLSSSGCSHWVVSQSLRPHRELCVLPPMVLLVVVGCKWVLPQYVLWHSIGPWSNSLCSLKLHLVDFFDLPANTPHVTLSKHNNLYHRKSKI